MEVVLYLKSVLLMDCPQWALDSLTRALPTGRHGTHQGFICRPPSGETPLWSHLFPLAESVLSLAWCLQLQSLILMYSPAPAARVSFPKALSELRSVLSRSGQA